MCAVALMSQRRGRRHAHCKLQKGAALSNEHESRDSPLVGHIPGLVSFVTLLAAVTYAWLRSSYASFYSEFGVSPEQMGMGYTQILASGIRLVWSGVGSILIPISLVFFLIAIVTPRTLSKLKRPSRIIRISAAIVAVVIARSAWHELQFAIGQWGLESMGYYCESWGTSARCRWSFVAISVVTISVFIIMLILTFWDFFSAATPKSKRWPIIFGATFFIILVTSVQADVEAMRSQIFSGYAVLPERLRVLDVQVSRVALDSATADGLPAPLSDTPDRYFLLLGQSSDTTTIFDHWANKTIRIPSPTVALNTPAVRFSGFDAFGEYEILGTLPCRVGWPVSSRAVADWIESRSLTSVEWRILTEATEEGFTSVPTNRIPAGDVLFATVSTTGELSIDVIGENVSLPDSTISAHMRDLSRFDEQCERYRDVVAESGFE